MVFPPPRPGRRPVVLPLHKIDETNIKSHTSCVANSWAVCNTAHRWELRRVRDLLDGRVSGRLCYLCTMSMRLGTLCQPCSSCCVLRVCLPIGILEVVFPPPRPGRRPIVLPLHEKKSKSKVRHSCVTNSMGCGLTHHGPGLAGTDSEHLLSFGFAPLVPPRSSTLDSKKFGRRRTPPLHSPHALQY